MRKSVELIIVYLFYFIVTIIIIDFENPYRYKMNKIETKNEIFHGYSDWLTVGKLRFILHKEGNKELINQASVDSGILEDDFNCTNLSQKYKIPLNPYGG